MTARTSSSKTRPSVRPTTTANPEVLPALERRVFSNADKLRILAEADACTPSSGERGALLGGFNPLQSDTLNAVAAHLGATPNAVALAWLLQRSPNILLIPGTSSVEHLRENVAAAAITLPEETLARLNAIGTRQG